MYRVIITHNDGQKQVVKNGLEVDVYELAHMVEKCQIKSYRVKL